MLVAYFTTDEVHEDTALQLAADYGAMLCTEPFRGQFPDGEFDAVVYDWDYLSPPYQQAVMSFLLAKPPPHPVAVHSYHLSDDEFWALHQNGVQVHRRLEPALFLGLLLSHTIAGAAGAHDPAPKNGNADSNRRR
jgi:hypothetical protein